MKKALEIGAVRFGLGLGLGHGPGQRSPRRSTRPRRGERIDVLINNASALFARRRLTQDGLEFTFALNHMAYFVLTEGLRERLIASRPARIINTASAAHQDATLDFDDLQSAKSYKPLKAYSRSKLCNILFYAWARAHRLQDTGVTANCLHPGFVATRFGDHSGGSISRVLWLAKFFAISPDEGAEPIVYLASSPDVVTTTGQYYYECFPTMPSSAARDDRPALLLWQRSALLAGMKEKCCVKRIPTPIARYHHNDQEDGESPKWPR
jgi:NAD(P)-dependent dehydrogenase (short-subunit alcohol dehydrogenase family)